MNGPVPVRQKKKLKQSSSPKDQPEVIWFIIVQMLKPHKLPFEE